MYTRSSEANEPPSRGGIHSNVTTPNLANNNRINTSINQLSLDEQPFQGQPPSFSQFKKMPMYAISKPEQFKPWMNNFVYFLKVNQLSHVLPKNNGIDIMKNLTQEEKAYIEYIFNTSVPSAAYPKWFKTFLSQNKGTELVYNVLIAAVYLRWNRYNKFPKQGVRIIDQVEISLSILEHIENLKYNERKNPETLLAEVYTLQNDSNELGIQFDENRVCTVILSKLSEDYKLVWDIFMAGQEKTLKNLFLRIKGMYRYLMTHPVKNKPSGNRSTPDGSVNMCSENNELPKPTETRSSEQNSTHANAQIQDKKKSSESRRPPIEKFSYGFMIGTPESIEAANLAMKDYFVISSVANVTAVNDKSLFRQFTEDVDDNPEYEFNLEGAPINGGGKMMFKWDNNTTTDTTTVLSTALDRNLLSMSQLRQSGIYVDFQNLCLRNASGLKVASFEEINRLPCLSKSYVLRG